VSAPEACSRRVLLRALAGTGAVLAPGLLVAGCGSGAPAVGAGASGPAPQGRVPAADVPVGTARVVDVGGAPVVVAQPAEGEFAAYSAVCPHQGGVVASSRDTVVTCPLHGSQFDTADGAAVVQGPAEEPLGALPLAVDGADLVVGG